MILVASKKGTETEAKVPFTKELEQNELLQIGEVRAICTSLIAQLDQGGEVYDIPIRQHKILIFRNYTSGIKSFIGYHCHLPTVFFN